MSYVENGTDVLGYQKDKVRMQRAEAEKKEAEELKKAQYEIIQKENPMMDDCHTGVRSVSDIKTFYEAMAEGQKDADGTVFTVLTEIDSRREAFADFYTNKKGPSDARKTHSEEARDSSYEPLSGAKVGNNSESASAKNGNSIREQRVYHGSGADFLDLSREALAGIMLILKYDVQRQKKWILWLYHNHPTEDEIMARLIKETEARQTKCK